MIFIIRGTSCSGKDTFIEKHFKEHCVLSSDKFRLMLIDNMKDQSKNGVVFENIKHILEQRLRFGVAYTVINATNLKYKDCQDYFDLAERFGENVTVISIDPPSLEVLFERSKNRGSLGGLEVPNEVIERHYNSYFTSMDRFIEVTGKSDKFSFVRINQDWDFVL